jgi:hypothetical protein
MGVLHTHPASFLADKMVCGYSRTCNGLVLRKSPSINGEGPPEDKETADAAPRRSADATDAGRKARTRFVMLDGELCEARRKGGVDVRDGHLTSAERRLQTRLRLNRDPATSLRRLGAGPSAFCPTRCQSPSLLGFRALSLHRTTPLTVAHPSSLDAGRPSAALDAPPRLRDAPS